MPGSCGGAERPATVEACWGAGSGRAPRLRPVRQRNVLQGAHHHPDAMGRVTRLALALGVIPVFAPPREPGLKCRRRIQWLVARQSFAASSLRDCRRLASRLATWSGPSRQTAHRRDPQPGTASSSRASLGTHCSVHGSMIFIRRSDEHGACRSAGTPYPVARTGRTTGACGVEFTHQRIRFYACVAATPTSSRCSTRVTLPSYQQTIFGHTMSVQLTLRLGHVDVEKVFN